ncbi:MAG: hypothetical protein OXE52_10215 [Chloroflexi bacterium]|nr:hypothetical protein [Chloroflexota bacterium]
MSTTLAKARTFPTHQIKSYLERERWSLINENERWIIFQGDHPVDIALPKDISAPDYHVYVEHALKTLSSATGKTPDAIVNDILRYDRDIFDLRITENADPNSTPLRLAFKAISGLKQLFVCAADSEVKDAKPYYPRDGSNPRRILDEIRFGHTFSGSFGYSVESPIKTQTNMFMAPLPQRVMERIVIGLATTDKATKMQDVTPLIDGYETGFSANMCDAILSMSDDHSMAIEFSIKWSKKRKYVPDDLKEINSVNIQQNHFEYLKSASNLLRDIQPEFVTVEGTVASLKSPKGPQSADDVDRNVTIKWEMEEGKTRTIVVALETNEYAEAWSAHWDNRLVSVKGYIQGSERLLSEPRDFKVIG